MIRYCTNCILPSTRPNLIINPNGICQPCSLKFHSKSIFDNSEKLIKKIKANKNNNWDCIIPVSGGKDSTWQTIKCLEKGLKPLCFSWKTPARNEIGRKNLENLINLGVDHLDISINPKVEKALILKSLILKGSVAIPMHMAIYAIALDLAKKYKINDIVFGENPAKEYGSKKRSDLTSKVNKSWLKKYGVNGGVDISYWYDKKLGLNKKSLSSYEVKFHKNINIHFLGDYISWDPAKTYSLSKKLGFKKLNKPVIGFYNYADIDDGFIMSVHHWLKWHKFGFTRTWDNLSLEIRYGRMTRKKAIKKIKETGLEYPHEEIKYFCKYVGISISDFNKITNKKRNNNWFINNFLIPDWKWNET